MRSSWAFCRSFARRGRGPPAVNTLGTAVFGGMLAATVLALFFVPVFFVVMQWLSELLRKPALQKEFSPRIEKIGPAAIQTPHTRKEPAGTHW